MPAWAGLDSINPGLDLDLGLDLLKTQAWAGLDLVNQVLGLDLDLDGHQDLDLDLGLGLGVLKVWAWAGLDLVDLGLDVLKVWAWTGLGPENQVQVQAGLQDLAKLLIPVSDSENPALSNGIGFIANFHPT